MLRKQGNMEQDAHPKNVSIMKCTLKFVVRYYIAIILTRGNTPVGVYPTILNAIFQNIARRFPELYHEYWPSIR